MKPLSPSTLALLLIGLSSPFASPTHAQSAAKAAAPIAIPDDVLAVERDRIAAVARAMPSAVSIYVPGGGGGGSGVLISPDGDALTNFHVTSPAGQYMRCSLADGRVYDAVIVGIDPVGDLAMIRLLGRDDFPAAEFGNSLIARAGDWCMAIGNPFLLATNLQPTVSWGILSGVNRYQYPSGTLLEYGDCLQTDAAINPGNSGGPLYDASGRLLGIIGRCSFEKRGRVNVGVGYAISGNQAIHFLGCLRSGRIVDHATLGATVATDADDGVVVTNILESSDAYRRGLRFGSEILEIDGRPVTTANELQNVIATLPAQWRVKLAFRQDGRTTQTLVRLASVHQQDELLEKMAAALPPPPPREPDQPGPDQPGPDQPGPDQPGPDQPGPDQPGPPQDAPPGDAAGSTIPAAARAILESRNGYANYHFNRQHQERLSRQLGRQFPAAAATSSEVWTIRGRSGDDDAREVTIGLSPQGITMSIGGEAVTIDSGGQRFAAIEDRTPAGLAIALDNWRQMRLAGPAGYGETYYYGTMPLGGERPLRDVLVGLRTDTETRWLSHPETGLLEAIEVFVDPDTDPAELWIRYDQTADAATARCTGLQLRYGVDTVLDVVVDAFEVGPAQTESAQTQAAPAPVQEDAP